MKAIFRKEVLIGVLVILALAILFFGINFLKGVNIFKAANYFYASYSNVEGLAQSAPVTLNGYKVGIVREMHYNYERPGEVTVEMSLDKKLRLPRGTRAAVSTDLLGTASIVLTLGNPADGFYAVGDTVVGEQKAGLMDAVGKELMPAVSAIAPKIDSLLTSLNALVSDPALAAAIHRTDAITAELDATLRSLHSTLAALRPATEGLASIAANVDTVTSNLATVSGTIKEAPVDSLVRNLQGTAANLETLTARLNNPESTIGRLTGDDDELYRNINAAVMSLDSLLVDVKENPKRYIHIKVF